MDKKENHSESSTECPGLVNYTVIQYLLEACCCYSVTGSKLEATGNGHDEIDRYVNNNTRRSPVRASHPSQTES